MSNVRLSGTILCPLLLRWGTLVGTTCVTNHIFSIRSWTPYIHQRIFLSLLNDAFILLLSEGLFSEWCRQIGFPLVWTDIVVSEPQYSQWPGCVSLTPLFLCWCIYISLSPCLPSTPGRFMSRPYIYTLFYSPYLLLCLCPSPPLCQWQARRYSSVMVCRF